MQIQLFTATETFTLGDDSALMPFFIPSTTGMGGAVIESGPIPAQERIVQLTPLVRAAYQFGAPRYNLLNSVRFEVLRTFATYQLCSSFLYAHADALPASGELIIVDDAGGGRAAFYWPVALPKSCRCTKRTGVTCQFAYELVMPCAMQISP